SSPLHDLMRREHIRNPPTDRATTLHQNGAMALRMFLLACAVSCSVAVWTQQDPPKVRTKPDTGVGGLFSSYEPLTVRLQAPFGDLFSTARDDNLDYSVAGIITYTDSVSGRDVIVDNVAVSLRGHSSKQEDECSFPKRKLGFRRSAALESSIFAGMRAVKIGTHCDNRPDGQLTQKFGRLANEKAPLREAAVYRLLDVMKVPTLKVRPA